MAESYPLDFLLFVPLNNQISEIEKFTDLSTLIKQGDRNKVNFYCLEDSKFTIINDHDKFFAVGGDPIGFNKSSVKDYLSKKLDFKEFLINVSGHYYLFYFSGGDSSLLVSSSLFSIFPLFYYKNDESILISSRLRLITNYLPLLNNPDKKFIVEQILFNYPLFNNTIFQDIKLCPTNNYIKIEKNNLNFIKHTDATEFYITEPKKGKDSVEELRSLFVDRFKIYVPEDKIAISFTGGFDGRTLLSCAKFYNKEFTTFSVGTRNNDDIYVPQENANLLGIPYKPFLLDVKNYIENDYYNTGQELIDLTSGFSNLLYVHFLYSAKKLRKESNYLFAGYFGSELFRALHLAGAVNSKELVSFFRETDEDKWIHSIIHSPKLKYLNIKLFHEEIEEIIEELRKYKIDNYRNFNSLNKFFYKYVLEEIFRKIFGPQIFSQSNFINVRTPFLDIQFIIELFKSEIAGVNNDFFTHNPLKRIKGQLLYANIISKAFPELALIKTQKGYTPNDLLTLMGNFNILLPYILKKIRRKTEKPYLDNLSIISGLKNNWLKLRKEITSNEFYNIVELDKSAITLDNLPESERDILALAASSSIYLNTLNKG